MKWFFTFWQKLLSFLFPPECVGCGKDDTFLCADCQQELLKTQQTKKEETPLLDHLWILSDYHHPWIAQLIKHLKFHFALDVVKDLAQLLSALLQKTDVRGEILCPVPLHPRRERMRGFNQSLLLAKVFAKYLDIPVQALLERHRHTVPQASLSRADRLQNLSGAFSLAPLAQKLEKNTHILLVDDVGTTLATLSECAKTLRNAGFSKVSGIVIARGQ